MTKYPKSRLVGLCQHKGKSYVGTYGIEKAKQIKEKMRLAKLGKSFKWGKPHPSGIEHPRWIKDRSQVKRQTERNSPLYKQWSRAVKNRDSWKCRIANSDCNGKVVAHHILTWHKYPELRFDTNNGITLCHAHHPRRRAEEKRLEPVFKALVSASN